MAGDTKSSYYKYCIVPLCTNTTHTSGDKLFFSVPKDANRRKTWINAMKRDDKLNSKLSCKSSLWCCEDHFLIEEDMENFLQWKLTKDVTRLKLKEGTVPHRFECQKRDIQPPIERKGAKKRKHLSLIEEALNPPVASTSTDPLEELDMETNKVDFMCQVDIKKPFRCKGTNTNIQVSSIGCSPIKMAQNSHLKENTVQVIYTPNDDIVFHDSESDYECSIDSPMSSEIEEMESNKFKEHMLIGTIMCIEKDPKLFLGLPPKSFFIIKLLTEKAPLPTKHIYIVLKKIRLNMQFSVMALEFGLSVSSTSRIFSKSLPVISNLLRELIMWPTRQAIQANLPAPFRARYGKVESIVDCLEIPIEKPSNPIHQALTWSNYYNCNTVKYLVSCTPDGLVSFISEGYGGRISDQMIIEDSGYLNKLNPGALVMADRGFKNIAPLLELRGCSLVRPPSVSASRVCTKAEVKLSKRIAALRIHVERVIGRLRDFSLLEKHACIDHNLVPYLDYAIIISCGLINMQDHLIKK